MLREIPPEEYEDYFLMKLSNGDEVIGKVIVEDKMNGYLVQEPLVADHATDMNTGASYTVLSSYVPFNVSKTALISKNHVISIFPCSLEMYRFYLNSLRISRTRAQQIEDGLRETNNAQEFEQYEHEVVKKKKKQLVPTSKSVH